MNKNRINNRQLKLLSNSVKQDNLMETSNYHLTVNEQQLLLGLIKKMKDNNPEVKFNSKDYVKLAGLSKNDIDSDQVATRLEKLNSKNFWTTYYLNNGHKEEALLSWFTSIEIDVDTGIFTVTFNRDLWPFLLRVKSKLNDDARKLE